MKFSSDLLFDMIALAVFLAIWIGYAPLMRDLTRGRSRINTDMLVIRGAWMRAMMRRPPYRLLDSQLIGHALNTASFFASSNLILLAAAAGALSGGETVYRKVLDVPLLAAAPRGLFEVKLAVIAATLARSLIDFIWAIRQMNYAVAVVGAAPRSGPPARMNAYAEAATGVLNPALSAFSSGVRGYYFGLAAAAWLFGPAALLAATIGAFALLFWRQSASPASAAVHRARLLLEESEEGDDTEEASDEA
ncbi:MAG: DUF599 family protein [Caulobacteraceae bacterium]